MQYVFLVLFGAFSIWHLYYSWIDDKRGRARTKPFLLIFLTLYYAFATENLSLLLLFALITSWLGDVLLIPRGNIWFSVGGASFFACHVLFILTYAKEITFSLVPWTPVIIMAVLYVAVAGFIMSKVWKTTPFIMRGSMFLYLVANATMNVFALMQLLTNHSAGAIVAYIGAVLFFISDCSLFLVRYYKGKQVVFKKHFTVMLTYLVGEFMIAQGMILLGS